jgi:hypothetical protein
MASSVASRYKAKQKVKQKDAVVLYKISTTDNNFVAVKRHNVYGYRLLVHRRLQWVCSFDN